MRQLVAGALSWLAAGIAAAAPAHDCLDRNLPGTLRVQEVEMTTWDRAGQERVMRGRIFGSREKAQARIMARVDFPGDLAGAAFLVREAQPAAEFYVYLPSVNRVKRLAGSSMNGKLWGTDFSYSEFRRVAGAFGSGQLRRAGTAQHDGRAVHDLELAPGQDDPDYDSIRVLADQQTCVPLRAEFRRSGQVRKLLTAPAAGLRQAGSHWYPAELTLHDRQLGTRTRLRVLALTAGVRLSASTFHPQQFHSVR